MKTTPNPLFFFYKNGQKSAILKKYPIGFCDVKGGL